MARSSGAQGRRHRVAIVGRLSLQSRYEETVFTAVLTFHTLWPGTLPFPILLTPADGCGWLP